MKKYQKGGSPKKEPVKVEKRTNLIGRTTNYKQVGKDTKNDWTETVTNRKGRVVRESSGSYEESRKGDILKDTENVKKYNKAGDVRKEKSYDFRATPTDRNYGYDFTSSVSKNGQPVRSRSETYKETPKETIDKGKVENYKKGKTRYFDKSTTNFNEGYKKGGTITALDQVDRMEKAKLLKNKK
jgi:hypothetical protein